jgi:hypothetical protein
MPLTNYAKNRVLKNYFGDTPVSPPGTFYLALFTVAPTVAGGGTEVVGGSYARIGMVNDTTNWPVPTTGEIIFQALEQFTTPTANWGTVVAVALMDALVAGNMEAFYVLPTPKVINTGDNYAFPVGNIIVRLAGS